MDPRGGCRHIHSAPKVEIHVKWENGEEDYIVSHMSNFRYVEVEGEIHETLCQAFETVQVVRDPHQEDKKPEASMVSYRQAQMFI